MKSGATVIIDRANGIVEALSKLMGQRTLVGIPSSSAGRQDGPITNAAIGYIHEHGAPEANIPARPHLTPGIESVKDQITEKFKQVGEAAFNGEAGKVDKGFEQVGIIASTAVKKKVNEGIPPPLAESTLSGRRRKGRTGTKPLIDTAQYRNAITYVVRKSK